MKTIEQKIHIYDEIIAKKEKEKEEQILLSIEKEDKEELLESISLEIEAVIREYINENKLNIAEYLEHDDILTYLRLYI
tara:strand:+ start:268 stop:504 length:237 start_codon:yes stop_codon:yes gene_type:complete